MGYHLAGFDVTGVDKDPQPHYPFTVIQADALEYIADHGHEYDLIHASWPCQHKARVTAWRGSRDDHPELITPGREAMESTGRPWVIENVPEAAWDGTMRADYMLCGTHFDLKVKRHRAFETSWGWDGALLPPCGRHAGLLAFEHKGERAYADAMGCTWMSAVAAREAIPPAYTRFIGDRFLAWRGAVTAP
ncbi:DNA cytosine methyltransferase [Streptomyces sp. 184]|uniref:DNA cytosine methyltransferase n=1 Tax=Streptomyces sp. 184 TaxID=1827526 RepID=UPI003892AC00